MTIFYECSDWRLLTVEVQTPIGEGKATVSLEELFWQFRKREAIEKTRDYRD